MAVHIFTLPWTAETGGLLQGVAVHTCNTVVDGRDRRIARVWVLRKTLSPGNKREC